MRRETHALKHKINNPYSTKTTRCYESQQIRVPRLFQAEIPPNWYVRTTQFLAETCNSYYQDNSNPK